MVLHQLGQGIEGLFGDAGATAGAGVSSGGTGVHEDARNAWERANPFEWYRQEYASRHQQRQQQAAEEAEEAGTAMTLARACEVLELPPPPAPLLRDAMLAAYRRMARQCHPDKRTQHNLNDEQATARMQEVNEAKHVLMREIMAENDLQ